MTYLDLTHPFISDMPVYPGDPKPEITQYASLNDDGYNDFIVKTNMHVGTHVDAPLHFITGGKKIIDIPTEQLIGMGVIIDARGHDKIDIDLLQNVSINKDDIVLICTGFDKKYRTPDYYDVYLSMTEAFAEKIVELGVKMLGVDGPSPDREPFPIHKILLGKDILIAENLANLDQLIGIGDFEVIALPVKYDTEAAPARIIARY